MGFNQPENKLDSNRMTLNTVLSKLGYRTEQDPSFLTTGRKRIINKKNQVCECTGNSDQVWFWLRDTGKIK